MTAKLLLDTWNNPMPNSMYSHGYLVRHTTVRITKIISTSGQGIGFVKKLHRFVNDPPQVVLDLSRNCIDLSMTLHSRQGQSRSGGYNNKWLGMSLSGQTDKAEFNTLCYV